VAEHFASSPAKKSAAPRKTAKTASVKRAKKKQKTGK
jgi:hypothetical protein